MTFSKMDSGVVCSEAGFKYAVITTNSFTFI